MQRLCLTILLFLAATSSLAAQELRAMDKFGGNLWSINAKTAQMQFIGSTGLNIYLWEALAMDSQGKLYSAYGRDFAPYAIYEIDPDTAQATFVVQTNFIGLIAMAFGPGDTLYLVNERDSPLIQTPIDLYTLDLSTGATTYIGEMSSGGLLIRALDFYGGELYGFGGGIGLVKIDTQTAQVTDINPAIPAMPTVTVSMCFSESGALYYLDRSLWTLDSQTGAWGYVNRTQLPGFWSEAEFFEGPKDPFALWLGGHTNGPMTVNCSGATANGNVAFAWERGGAAPAGPTPIPAGFPCAGTQVDLSTGMQLFGILSADASGKVSTPPQFVPAGAARAVRIQAIDLTTCETSNQVLISF